MTARQEIKADMLRRIRESRWEVGACIPTLDQLERLYPYSRRTISLAIGELASLGILSTRGKAGTVVHCAPGKSAVGILVNYGVSTRINAQFAYSLGERLHENLRADGHEVRIYHETPGFLETEAPPCQVLMEDMGRNMLAGLVTVASNLPEWVRRHPDRSPAIPVVNISYHPSRYRVYVDFPGSVEVAIEALAATGRRRVGLIGCPHRDVPAHFTRRAVAAGLQTRPQWLFTREAESVDEGYGFEGLHRLWATEPRPEAVFIPDDIAAKGVAQAALALGIRDDELLLICQRNEGIEHFYPFPMGSICLPLGTLADAAIGLLCRAIVDPGTPPADIRIRPVNLAEEPNQHTEESVHV